MRSKKNRPLTFDLLEQRQLLSTTVTNPDGSTTTTTDHGSVINYSKTGNGATTLSAYDAPTFDSGNGSIGGFIDATAQYVHVQTSVDYHDGMPVQSWHGDAAPWGPNGWVTATLLGPYHNAVWHYSSSVTETMDLTQVDGTTEHLSYSANWPAPPQDQYNPPDNIKPDGSRPGRIMYSLDNPYIAAGNDLVYLPTAPVDSFGNYVNMIGHKFDLYVRAGSDSNGLSRAIDHVTWTIPDAITTASWSPSAGFQQTFMTQDYDPRNDHSGNATHGSNSYVTAYWAHGNPDRPDVAPITTGGSWDMQTIQAHVYYHDGTDEVLDTRAPVAAPKSTYSVQYGPVTLGPSHIHGEDLAIKTGDPSYSLDPSGNISTVGQMGYTGTMIVDPSTTWRMGGTAGLLQTVNPYLRRIWIDTNMASHEDRILMMVDPITGHLVSNPPYLDDDADNPNVLMNVWNIGTGTGTPIVRTDAPYVVVPPDFFYYYVDEKFTETGMYRPGPQNDSNSIYVPLFKTEWEFTGEIYNNVRGGFGPNYHSSWMSDPHTTSQPVTVADYPTWHANGATGAGQVTGSWQQFNWWGGTWGSVPGPHAPDWFSASTDTAHPVYVSTKNTTTQPGYYVVESSNDQGHDLFSKILMDVPVSKKSRLVAQATKAINDFGLDFLSPRRTHAAG